MFASSSRLVVPTCTQRATLTTATTTSRARPLRPVRYHIFRTPLPYTVGLNLQNTIIDRRLASRERDKDAGRQDILLLLEHTPTYTTGRRDNSPNPDTLHPEERKVQNVGAEFYITKRGGQVTYHGPGQLVGYPIFDLDAMETSTRCYVSYLQSLLAGYVSEDLGVEGVLAPHPDGHVGVFASPTEKVASIGIHLRHRITSHGFAINITPEPLKWFDLVLACGLSDVRAVCLHDLLERSASRSGLMPGSLPSVEGVARRLVSRFGEVFDREFTDLGDGDGGGEVDELREMVGRAEEEARRGNGASGGWAREPDLSKRVL